MSFDMQLFLSIMLWLMIGSATAYFANQRGRDPLVWFMVGMLIGLLGLLLLFLLPPVTEEDVPHEGEEELSLDSKTDPTTDAKPHDYLVKDWYYYDREKNRQGPIRFDALKKLWQAGDLSEETYIWSEGMTEWKKIEEVPNLHTHLVFKEES